MRTPRIAGSRLGLLSRSAELLRYGFPGSRRAGVPRSERRFLGTALAVLLMIGLARALFAQPTVAEGVPSRFCAVDVYVDSQAVPLAAYQIELAVTNGGGKIVGIEGGEHPAFRQPPFYDPKAMRHERVIIAAFNTGKDLPSGKTRVATIHLQIAGTNAPQCDLKLLAAGNANGDHVPATVSFQERKSK